MKNLNRIKAVIFDFDGVFTDNRVIISEDGKESVICNRSDGIGLNLLRELNIQILIISSEKNPVVKMRAKKLNIPVINGVSNKAEELIKFSKSENINIKNIAFLGNDINDAECMKKVGFPVAVKDAYDDIKLISLFVLDKKGGDGAVRELCDLIYKSYKYE